MKLAEIYPWLPGNNFPGTISVNALKPVLIAFAIFVLFWLLSGYLARLAARVLSRIFDWNKTPSGQKLIKALEKPFRMFLVLVGLYIAMQYLPLSAAVEATLLKGFRILVIVLTAWVLYDLAGTDSLFSEGMQEKLRVDNIILSFFSKLTRFFILAIAIVVIIQEWGYRVDGLIAGLGLGGLAVALATKDALANVVAGLVIIMEKPFLIGDWISTPSAEGTVEDISFRSTKIRSTTQALITVPNSTLAAQPITNHARMGKRRLEFTLPLAHDMERPKVEKIVLQTRDILNQHPEIEQDTVVVALNTIGKDVLEVLVRCFVVNTRWEDFMQVREDINLSILDITNQFAAPKEDKVLVRFHDAPKGQ
ncbi:MAG: mechanosensitive ion channel family protein [Syntrophomonadaceae bacterium]